MENDNISEFRNKDKEITIKELYGKISMANLIEMFKKKESKEIAVYDIEKEVLFQQKTFKRQVISQSELEKTFVIQTDAFEYKENSFSFKRVRLTLNENSLTILPLESNKNIYDKPLMVLNFNQLTLSIQLPKDNPENRLKIFVLGCDNHFEIRTNQKDLFDQFLIYLNYNVRNSRGFRENMIGVSLRKDFYKSVFISEREYIQQTKTGDLLIFKGFDCPSGCQRFFTRAEYDHVALLIKNDDRLYVFEATAKDGCKAREWNDFVRYSWHVLYEKMVIRKLNVKLEGEAKQEFYNNYDKTLKDFIKKTEKKPYRLTCNKLCSGSAKDYEKNNEWEKCKGFFCSQLVAASLMRLDIMKSDKGAGYYLPGAFSENGNLDCNDHYEYGPEIIIDFSL